MATIQFGVYSLVLIMLWLTTETDHYRHNVKYVVSYFKQQNLL